MQAQGIDPPADSEKGAKHTSAQFQNISGGALPLPYILCEKAKLFSKKFLTFQTTSYRIIWSANADYSLLPARPGAIQTIRRCNQHG